MDFGYDDSSVQPLFKPVVAYAKKEYNQKINLEKGKLLFTFALDLD